MDYGLSKEAESLTLDLAMKLADPGQERNPSGVEEFSASAAYFVQRRKANDKH
jgi:hypothetical protein